MTTPSPSVPAPDLRSEVELPQPTRRPEHWENAYPPDDVRAIVRAALAASPAAQPAESLPPVDSYTAHAGLWRAAMIGLCQGSDKDVDTPDKAAAHLRARLIRTSPASMHRSAADRGAVQPEQALTAQKVFNRANFDSAAFFAAIERAMQHRDMTAKQLSEATGISETTLSRMRGGDRACDAASLAALSGWAGINPATYCTAPPAPLQVGAEPSAKQQYDALVGGDELISPVERLRAFCSLAMKGQDWLDVEPFFDALAAQVEAPKGEPVAKVHDFLDGDYGVVRWLPHTGDPLDLGDALYATPQQDAAPAERLKDEAPIQWPKERDLFRDDDMGHGTLRVLFDSDNDVIVSIWPEGEPSVSLEFCNGGGGGGKSPNVRVALIGLMCAMEKDGATNRPQDRAPAEAQPSGGERGQR